MLAGAVAFRIFLFLVPYVFVAVVGFGFAAEAADTDAADLARQAGIGGLVAKAVGGAEDLSGFSRVTALLVGIVALFFGTRALLKVLRIVYGLIWRVSPPKPKKAAISALAVIGLTTVLFIFVGVIDNIRDQSFALGLLGIFVLSLVPFTVTLVVSFYLPRQPTRWPELIPGALFLTLGTLVLHIVTVYWIRARSRARPIPTARSVPRCAPALVVPARPVDHGVGRHQRDTVAAPSGPR